MKGRVIKIKSKPMIVPRITRNPEPSEEEI
jgi:hypothetical protein